MNDMELAKFVEEDTWGWNISKAKGRGCWPSTGARLGAQLESNSKHTAANHKPDRHIKNNPNHKTKDNKLPHNASRA